MSIHKLLIIFFFLVVCEWMYAQTWIQLDKKKNDEAVTAEILESDQYSYKVKVIIHRLSDIKIENENGEFHRLSFGRESFQSKVGEPLLPLFTQSIAIPAHTKVSATISEDSWIDIDIGKILPMQRSLLETEHTKDFDIDEWSYHNSYYPSILNIGEEMQWRNIHNVDVSVCPFRYYPEENRLSIMNEFILSVSFSGNQRQSVDSDFEPDDPLSLFDNLPYTNSKSLKEKPVTKLNRNADEYDYLIIVGNNAIFNSDKLKEFQRWKAFKGYRTKTVSTTTTGTTPSQIKSYISQEKDNGIKYVLFVGDYAEIPSASVLTARNRFVESDYWYGCLDGDNDLQAEIPIGRFSVESLTDFEHMVDKTIKYEKEYNPTNEVLLVAHAEGAGPYYPDSFQSCCEQIYNTHNGNVSFTEAYGSEYYGNNATNAFVVGKINQGAHIVNYRGHGSPTFWGGESEIPSSTIWNDSHESFTISEINNMDSETCAIFFSVACQTGRLYPNTCMLEAFTRSAHGAVAFIGATEDTNHYVNNGYNKLLFNKLLTNNVFHIGDLNISAHIANDLTSSIYNKDNPFCYLCGGDPSLEIWTAEPSTITAYYSESNGYMTVSTNLSSNYYISIVSMDGERLDSIPCSSNICSFQIPSDKFFMVINKHNYFPKILYYDSISTSIVNMRFDYDAYYSATPLDIHTEAAQFDEDEGTIVKSGSKLVIKNGSGGVTINVDFECEAGAVFEIK